MLYTKPAIEISSQIRLLQSRGLIITDKHKAEHFLSNIGYYRLSGYWWPLQLDKVNHLFKPNSTFDTVIDLYNFDRELRLIVFNMIERIEIGMRTQLIYNLSLNYSPWWFENDQLFNKRSFWKEHLETIRQEVERSKEVFVVEHLKKYKTDQRCPPAWKSLEIISFGLLSKLFGNLKNNLPEKKLITQNLEMGNHRYLSSWLRSISVVRNICAHHGRLWNRNFPFPPKLLVKAPLSWVGQSSLIDQHSFCAILICIIYLLQTISPHNRFKERLEYLLEFYPNVDVKAMGFPENWTEEPIWQ